VRPWRILPISHYFVHGPLPRLASWQRSYTTTGSNLTGSSRTKIREMSGGKESLDDFANYSSGWITVVHHKLYFRRVSRLEPSATVRLDRVPAHTFTIWLADSGERDYNGGYRMSTTTTSRMVETPDSSRQPALLLTRFSVTDGNLGACGGQSGFQGRHHAGYATSGGE